MRLLKYFFFGKASFHFCSNITPTLRKPKITLKVWMYVVNVSYLSSSKRNRWKFPVNLSAIRLVSKTADVLSRVQYWPIKEIYLTPLLRKWMNTSSSLCKQQSCFVHRSYFWLKVDYFEWIIDEIMKNRYATRMVKWGV